VNFLDEYPDLKGNFQPLLNHKDKKTDTSKPDLKLDSTFDSKKLKKCLQQLDCKYLEKGEYLFKKGDPADNAYLILFGKVAWVTRKVKDFDLLKNDEIEEQERLRIMKPRNEKE